MDDRPEIPDPAEPASSPVGPAWPAWPHCPGCGAPRIAECPGCGETGGSFALADYQEAGAALEPTRRPSPSAAPAAAPPLYPLLICPGCGEVFRPIFYRRCGLCRQAFADGKEPPSMEPVARLPGAYVLASLALLAALGLLWWLAEGGPGRR